MKKQTHERTISLTPAVGTGDYLADHRVGDTALLPGTWFIRRIPMEMGFRLETHVLNRLRFHHPIFLERYADHRLRLTWSDDGDHGIGFSAFLIDPEQEPGEAPLIAEGWLQPAGEQVPTLPSDAFVLEEREGVEARAFYQALHQTGNCYGPRHQCVEGVWLDRRLVLGRVGAVPDPSVSDETPFHPARLDACIQVPAATSLFSGPTPRGPFMLEAIRSVRILEPLRGPLLFPLPPPQPLRDAGLGA